MNRNDDFDHRLEVWLRQQAPPQAPDRVLDASLDRVADESQRRGWLQRLIGGSQMTLYIRVAAVATVVAIAALIGFQFNDLVGNVGDSPSPSLTVVPTASPPATPSPPPNPSLPAGCVNPPTDISTLIDLQSTGPDDSAGDPVACYGDDTLTFDATWLGGGVADCPAAPEPAWLACSPFSLQAPGDTRKLGAPQLSVAVHPSASLAIPSEPYAQVQVTGHYDDAAAQTCRETQLVGDAETPAPAAELVERCRTTFVVTEAVALDP